MFPDLFSIGPLTVHTYGLFVAMGFAVGILVTVRLARTHGISAQQAMDMGLMVIVFAIIGSRLAYVLMNLSYYKDRPVEILKIWQGGLVFSGGLIAVILAMGWYLRGHRLSFWAAGDLWAPGVAIGQGIGRIGCFMAGCCFGKPTDVLWGVTFTNSRSLAPLNIPLHPTQLYAALSGFIIFMVLLFLHKRRSFEGQVTLWFLILHSFARLFLERFRGDDRGIIPGSEMSITQFLTLLILIASVITLYIMKTRQEKVQKKGQGDITKV